jgi:hypothetical protein
MDLWKAFAGQNWSFYTHQKLYDMVITEARGASAVESAKDAWAEFAKLMEDSRADIEQALNDAGASWEGRAAESMTSGVTPLAQWADDASIAGGASGAGVRNIGELFAFVSKAMPEPVRPPDPTSIFAEVLEGQADADQREREAQQARLRAIELMKGYSRNSEFAVSRLGTFVPPHSVTVAVASPELAGGAIHRATGEFTVPPTPTAGPTPSQSTVDAPVVAPGREGETRTTTTTPHNAATPLRAAELPPAQQQQSSGVSIAAASAPARQEHSRPAGSRGGGARGDGSKARGGGTTGTVPPGVDRPRVDRPSAARVAGFRAGGASPAGFGPFGAGAPARREEDGEHASPDYLLAYHDEFWVGDSALPPPVIGEED